jgi:hypothetical protein
LAWLRENGEQPLYVWVMLKFASPEFTKENNIMTTIGGLKPRPSFGLGVLILVSLFLLLTLAGPASAQSTDQDSPTPFTTNEVKGTGTEDKTEYFYSFNADPGEVTLTFDVKAEKNANLSGFDYEVLNAKGKRLVGGFVDPVRGESKRTVATVSVKGPGTQQLLLKLTVTEFVATFRVRLGGPVVVAAADSAAAQPATAAGGAVSPAAVPQTTPDPTAAQPTPTEAQPDPAATAAGQTAGEKPGKGSKLDFGINLLQTVGTHFGLPTSGTLHIVMKDGTTQDIDLSQVKTASVKKQ